MTNAVSRRLWPVRLERRFSHQRNGPQGRCYSCYDLVESLLEEKFEPAVVVPRQRGHYAFLANFAPITLVENVPDTREHSGSPLPKPKFGREIPNVIGGNEAFEGIAIVAEFIVNERAKKREFERILVAIDCAGLYLIFGAYAGVLPLLGPEVNSPSSNVTLP